jgi:hypothetical protein
MVVSFLVLAIAKERVVLYTDEFEGGNTRERTRII